MFCSTDNAGIKKNRETPGYSVVSTYVHMVVESWLLLRRGSRGFCHHSAKTFPLLTEKRIELMKNGKSSWTTISRTRQELRDMPVSVVCADNVHSCRPGCIMTSHYCHILGSWLVIIASWLVILVIFWVIMTSWNFLKNAVTSHYLQIINHHD